MQLSKTRRSDDRDLGTGLGTPAGDGELTHAYDPLGRLVGTELDGSALASYAYDRSANRRTVIEGGQTTATTFDGTDSPNSQTIDGGVQPRCRRQTRSSSGRGAAAPGRTATMPPTG